jgi:3-hydroxy-5-methyl-1-naphthoate 3-O-methyltransferase
MPTCDDAPIWNLCLSGTLLPSVNAADELGVFEALAAESANADELAERMGFDLRATRTLLRLLAALKLLVPRDGRYRLTDTARQYLLPASPYYWAPMLQMIGGRQPAPLEALKEAMRGRARTGSVSDEGLPETGDSGRPVDSWASGQLSLADARRIAAAMHSHSLPAAIALARLADLGDTSRLLDVGGGSGCFAIALARYNPGLRCTVMDLPAMCEVAGEYIAAGDAGNRVDTAPVDMFREPWPEGRDAMFFSNVFHDWSTETCLWLAKRCLEALPSGGRILLHEMLIDDDGAGPLTATAFSMLMLLGTQGQQFTARELTDLLEQAGFTGVRCMESYGGYSLVSARKP